jgi:hypothetical protein
VGGPKGSARIQDAETGTGMAGKHGGMSAAVIVGLELHGKKVAGAKGFPRCQSGAVVGATGVPPRGAWPPRRIVLLPPSMWLAVAVS